MNMNLTEFSQAVTRLAGEGNTAREQDEGDAWEGYPDYAIGLLEWAQVLLEAAQSPDCLDDAMAAKCAMDLRQTAHDLDPGGVGDYATDDEDGQDSE